jgi:serine/threonine-protein kinase
VKNDVAAPVEPGDVLAGKYRIERVLGAGGMGVVVAAMHLQLEQRVAIKFLLPEEAEKVDAAARFAREARAAAKIQSEHVARVLDVASSESGIPYMVMEYLEGKDLESTMQEQGRLPIENAVDYVLQALEALAEAHVAGIVHRDLKPANIFLARRADGSSVVKILDFGISKISRGKEPGLTTTSSPLGSPLYMSPEQLTSAKGIDARTDIWSLGVILQELIVGEGPFAADQLPELIAMILAVPPVSMRLRRPEVPPELEAVVHRCLEKEPQARFANVGELARALQPFAPSRSLVSIERVLRVIESRTENSLPPAAQTTTAGAEPPERSEFHDAPTLATNSSWHTSSRLRSGRTGRRLALGALAALAVAGVGVTVVVATRQPAQKQTAAAAPASATAAASAAAPPATQPATQPSTASQSPTDDTTASPTSPAATPASTASPASPPTGPRATGKPPPAQPARTSPTSPAPTSTAAAATIPAPSANPGVAPTTPPAATRAMPDYGGRK